jgi:hypothetical protein
MKRWIWAESAAQRLDPIGPELFVLTDCSCSLSSVYDRTALQLSDHWLARTVIERHYTNDMHQKYVGVGLFRPKMLGQSDWDRHGGGNSPP